MRPAPFFVSGPGPWGAPSCRVRTGRSLLRCAPVRPLLPFLCVRRGVVRAAACFSVLCGTVPTFLPFEKSRWIIILSERVHLSTVDARGAVCIWQPVRNSFR